MFYLHRLNVKSCKCNILAKEIEKVNTTEEGTKERKWSPQTEGWKFAVDRVKGGFSPLTEVGSDKPPLDMVCWGVCIPCT